MYRDTLVILNAGNAVLVVDTIRAGQSIIPPPGAELRIIPNAFNIAPGDTQFVAVLFDVITSSPAYAFSDSLLIFSNDPTDTVTTVILRGDYPSDITETGHTPTQFHLEQNYPNPFNPVTIINFILPIEDRVSLKVFDLRGQEVATLVDGRISAGKHEIAFDASGLSSGVYFCRLKSGRLFHIKKMILQK